MTLSEELERQREKVKARRRRYQKRRKTIYRNLRRQGYDSYIADGLANLKNERLEELGFDPKELLKER